MILTLLLDGFDTAFAGCTTHLASLLLLKALRLGAEPADYPWLVRLDPAVPWKTRGNGAVALHLLVSGGSEAAKLARELTRVARAYDAEGRKAALIALTFRDERELLEAECPRALYLRAVAECVEAEEALRCLRTELWARVVAAYGAERPGVVGALAALGGLRPSDDVTFELLTYREPARWGSRRAVDPLTVIEFDYMTGPYTFANYDYEVGRPLVAPHGPDPVLYGVRGEDPRYLLRALEVIDPGGEAPTHWALFRTNQATNAHVAHARPCNLSPYSVTFVDAVVERVVRARGGHVILEVRAEDGACGGARLRAAVYKEAGRLNRLAQAVEPGSQVRLYGSVKPRRGELVINVEALELLDPLHPDLAAYAVPGTSLVVASTASLHHLAKPFERYLNLRLLELRSLKARTPFTVLTPVAGPRVYT